MRTLFYYELKEKLVEMAEDHVSTCPDDGYNKDEKRLIDAIMMIRKLSSIARRKGLLELEESASKTDDTNLGKYLKKLIILVVDGTDPQMIKEIGFALYLSSYFRGYDGLIALIYLDGILSIQAGENPRVIEERLNALIPSYIRDLKEIIGTPEEADTDEFVISSKIDIDALCKQNSRLVPTDNGYHMIKLAEFFLGQLDMRSMTRLLRDIDNYDLDICIVAFNGSTRRHIFDCLSERHGNMLADDIYLMGPLRVNDIIASVANVMNVLLRLIEGGEIATDNQEFIRMLNSVFGAKSEQDKTDVQKNAQYLREIVDKYETDNNRLIYIV